MFRQNARIGIALGHSCGIVGAMIALDPVLARFGYTLDRVFPYPVAAAGIIGLLMIVLGQRLVYESGTKRHKGPWGQ
jgi:energy-converting hydrogenase Eha subunit A